MQDETVGDDDRHYGGRPVTCRQHDALAKAVAALTARVMRLEDTTTICAQDGTPLYMVQNANRTDEVSRALAVTDAHHAFEDWTRSVWRTSTGVSILATPPEGEVRPMLIVDLPEATARWLGGRILAALDVKAPKTTTMVAEEPKAAKGWADSVKEAQAAGLRTFMRMSTLTPGGAASGLQVDMATDAFAGHFRTETGDLPAWIRGHWHEIREAMAGALAKAAAARDL